MSIPNYDGYAFDYVVNAASPFYWWPLNEKSGTTAYDVVAGVNGAFSNVNINTGITPGARTQPNALAYKFNGISGIYLGSVPVLQRYGGAAETNWTSAWFKVSQTTGSNQCVFFINGAYVYIDPNGVLVLGFAGSSSYIIFPGNYYDGKPHNVAVRQSSTFGEFHAWIDGFPHAIPGSNGAGSSACYIGVWADGHSYPFNGLISDVIINGPTQHTPGANDYYYSQLNFSTTYVIGTSLSTNSSELLSFPGLTEKPTGVVPPTFVSIEVPDIEDFNLTILKPPSIPPNIPKFLPIPANNDNFWFSPVEMLRYDWWIALVNAGLCSPIPLPSNSATIDVSPPLSNAGFTLGYYYRFPIDTGTTVNGQPVPLHLNLLNYPCEAYVYPSSDSHYGNMLIKTLFPINGTLPTGVVQIQEAEVVTTLTADALSLFGL